MANLDLKSEFSKILINNGILEEIEKVEILESSNLAGKHLMNRCEYVRVQFKDGKREDSNFFVKRPTPFPDQFLSDAFAQVMLREGVFLQHIVNEMDQFYKKKLGDEKTFFEDMFPKAYYGEKDGLVLENIAKRGYSLSDTTVRQDLNQAKLVLKNLAKLHAVSHVLIKNIGSQEAFLEKYPTMLDSLMLTVFDPMLSRMFEPPFQRLFKLIHDSGVEGGKEAAEKLSKFNGNIVNTFRTMLKADSLLYSLNHGDCWNNNMMFSENRAHVILFDLQLTRINSPSIDIAYYLFTSTQLDVLSQWKDLLKYYYEEFKSTSIEIGSPINFTYDELVKDFGVKADMGFLYGILFAIGTEAMGTQDVDRDGFKEDMFDAMLVDYIPANREKVEGFVKIMINLLHIFEQVKTYA